MPQLSGGIMIESISTLRCSVCGLRALCHQQQAQPSPWIRQQIESFRAGCRNTRIMLAVYAVLVVMLALLCLRLAI
jgi:hypothetical protein